MRKIIPILIVLSVLGCTLNLEQAFKMIPMVQEFLNDHPNSEMLITYWTSEEVNSSMSEITDLCNKSLPIEPMYLARVSEGNFEVIAWFTDTYQLMCAVKPSVETSEGVHDQEDVVKEEIVSDPNKDSKIVISSGKDILLEGESTGEKVVLRWTIYEGTDFKYYKIVRSQTNTEPKYPEDGHIGVVTNRLKNHFYDTAPNNGDNFYGITVVKTNGSMIYSNPKTIRHEYQYEEGGVITEITLEAIVTEEGVVLEWTEIDNLQYYKVVRSQTETDPKYPEDSYIAVEDDLRYVDDLLNGTSYYRITGVKKDGSKIHSNVEIIEN